MRQIEEAEKRRCNLSEDEIGQRVFNQTLELFVGPEIERRQAAGQLERPVLLRRVQVLFFPDGRKNEVRINDEVRAMILAKISDGSKPAAGKVAYEHDIENVVSISLKDGADDPNAGHITALRFGDKWHLTYDFRYNKALVKEHATAAMEFLEAARGNTQNGSLRAAAEALFGAVELAAKAVLLSSVAVGVKTNHRAIHSAINRAAALGNVDATAREAFNKLASSRSAFRYLGGGTTPTIKDLQDWAEAIESLVAEAFRLSDQKR